MIFNDVFRDFIYFRTYSRWLDDEGRREFWHESVDRYRDFFIQKVPKSKQKEFINACEAKKKHEVMGSMRGLWTAGKALEKENLCLYNCSALVIDSIKSFSELLYILMNGAGVGYSVERQFVTKLPDIPKLEKVDDVVVFADSKLGWAEGFHKFLKKLYSGKIPKYDLSKIRPKGSPLKTFGGRASGGEVLENLLKFTIKLFKNSEGRKLNSCECNDLCCYIASVVVVGGVRRSSCISLSNLSDDRMRHAKDGQFWKTHPYRSLANNSVAYTEKPSSDTFLSEFLNLVRSGSGERGIFNRESCEFLIQQNEYRKGGYDWLCNPCSERILRPRGLCNLSEVIIRPDDDKDTLCRKVRQSTILGCVQTLYTNFNFVSREWKKNTEEERLIGVSLTGLRDHYILNRVSKEAKLWFTELRQVCIDTAMEWSSTLEINMPACQTCVKPSGSVSALTGTASGLHPRFAQFYIRRVRVAVIDPISNLLIDCGVPYKPENGQTKDNADTWVFEFPMKSPETSVLQEEVSAMDQLEYWLMLQKYWCSGKPSCTIHVADDEWIDVAAWVYKHWNYMSGVAFLPKSNSVYELMPFEEITESEYKDRVENFPEVDFSLLSKYEESDRTIGAQELACTGGDCEIV
jgi:ribonucleoside-diphosphate reductase alpha chain